MPIQKVVESEGHGSFYALIGLSLAVLLYPYYQWLLPFVSTGLVGQVDSALLILGATGVITGFLFAVPLDQIIDRIIEYKVGHESHSGWMHYFPTRQDNIELIGFVAGVDYLTSTWRTPAWISIEDSCKHAVSSAMKDPKIQKEIWTLKNRSVVGLAFVLWGFSVSTLGIQVIDLANASVLVGFLFLFIPWILGSSTGLATIIRQVAGLRYAEDTFSNWRPLGGRETGREPFMNRLAKDLEGIETLISDRQWDRLDRFYTWMVGMLDKHNRADYQVKERVYEIWARAIIEVVSAQNKEKPIEELVAKYQSAFDAFRKCGRNKLPSWAEKLTADDLTDFPRFMTDPNAWKTVDDYYGSFHHEILAVFEELTDEERKVNWMNALVVPDLTLSQKHIRTFFRFVCQSTSTRMNIHAYDLFLNADYLPYEEVTVSFIDRIVGLTDSASPEYDVNRRHAVFKLLIMLAERTDIKKDVRSRIIYHAESDSNIRGQFQGAFGSSWKEEVESKG